MFGKDKYKDVVREHADDSAKEILYFVIKELEQFSYSLKNEEDVMLAVLKIER